MPDDNSGQIHAHHSQSCFDLLITGFLIFVSHIVYLTKDLCQITRVVNGAINYNMCDIGEVAMLQCLTRNRNVNYRIGCRRLKLRRKKHRVENLILSLTNSKIKEAYFKELWYVEDDWKNNDEPKINFELAITEIVTV